MSMDPFSTPSTSPQEIFTLNGVPSVVLTLAVNRAPGPPLVPSVAIATISILLSRQAGFDAFPPSRVAVAFGGEGFSNWMRNVLGKVVRTSVVLGGMRYILGL